jgi:hypothetical protein
MGAPVSAICTTTCGMAFVVMMPASKGGMLTDVDASMGPSGTETRAFQV